jgi:hypothetical protein
MTESQSKIITIVSGASAKEDMAFSPNPTTIRTGKQLHGKIQTLKLTLLLQIFQIVLLKMVANLIQDF